jgi:hypothetical protein
MDPAKRRAIASKGGHAAHKKGVAHQWNTEEARDAVRKAHLARRRAATDAGGDTGGDHDVAAPVTTPGRQDHERP